MIESPLRLTLDWLTDADNGVNAQLADVPRPVGESAPPSVLFYNELEHPWVARNLIARDALKDESGPRAALIIRFPELDPEAEVQHPILPEQIADGVLVPVAVQYARRKMVSAAQPGDHAVLVRQARQTMRTVVRVIAQRFENAHVQYDVDECAIGIAPSGIQFASRYLDFGDDEVLDTLVIPYLVMDRWALGIPTP